MLENKKEFIEPVSELKIMKKLIIYSFCFYSICLPAMVSRPVAKIVPFVFEEHHKVLVRCAVESYQHIFSSSPSCLEVKSDEARKKYGLRQATLLGSLSNHLGQIDNHAGGSITSVKVLEVDRDPAGYIKYTSCYAFGKLQKNIGSIDQVALLKKYQGRDLGKLLVWNAFDDFFKGDVIDYVVLNTTSKEVGEKFYEKLGFKFLGSSESAVFPDETLYQWGVKIRDRNKG